MFGKRKKIRDLDDLLQKADEKPELKQLVGAILANQPEPASKDFEVNLKNQLIEQHKLMNKEKPVKEEKKFSLWADSRFRGWAVALATLLVVVLAGLGAYPLIPAPTVQGYLMKGATRQISVNAPFKIAFSQMMMNSSVEKNFSIDPAITGKFDWEGNTLVYTPDQARKIGDIYKITIDKGATSLLQKPLDSEYSEFYKIMAAPKVVLLTPTAGSVGVAGDSKINIMFDRPLTGLTTLEAGRSDFPDVRIEPAVTGRFKWLGTSALQFIPDKLNSATTYKVTVPKGTKVSDGGFTEEEFSTSFDTARPEAVSIVSTDGQSDANFSPKSTVKLTFNQQVNLDSAGASIKLQRNDKDKSVEEAVRVRYFDENDWKAEQDRAVQLTEMNQLEDVKVDTTTAVPVAAPEKPSYAELSKSVIVEPVNGLQPASEYSLLVTAGLKGLEGPLTTVADKKFSFKVAGNFTVDNAVAGIDAEQNGGFLANPVVTYSNPVNLHSFKGKINVTPPNKDDKGVVIAADLAIGDVDHSVKIMYDFKPATDYVVTVAQGVEDIYGDSVSAPTEIKFRTSDYKAAFSLEKGTDISVVDGSKAAEFYLKSVNIKSADVKLKKLSKDDFIGQYGNGYIDYEDLKIPAGVSVWEGSMPVKLVGNERGHSLMDLDKLSGAKLEAGFYYLEITSPGVTTTKCTYAWQTDNPGCEQAADVERALFVISRSALALKFSAGEMMVWATDLQNGQPINGMNVTLLTADKKQSLSGGTDVNGIAKIALPASADGYNSDYLVFGEKDGDMAFAHSTWSDGVSPWNFNINYQSLSPQYYMYLYTDRPIYRPGQQVFFKGILRQEKDYKFRLPEAKKVNVVITDSQGNDVYKQELPLSDNGTFNADMTLGQNVASGDYMVEASLVDVQGSKWLNNFNTSFKVYEYRKPEYKLDITPDQKDYVNGQTGKVKVEAGYFFGAPLPNAEVKWTLKTQDYYFILPEELANKLAGSWFSFAEEGYFCYWGCQGGQALVSQGSAKTDASGLATISLPFNINDKKISQIYTLEATVSDANNQSVSNRVSIPVHKGDFYIGVRSEDYIVSTDKPAKAQLLAVSSDGKVLAGKSIAVSSYERTWNTVKRKNVGGDYYFENNYDDKLLETKNVTSDADGLASVEFALKKEGSYLVVATAKDDHGNEVKSSTSVYVSGGGFVNWGSENNDKIELVTDKMEYKVGDTAKILVKSPYKNVYALVTYEKDKVLDQKVIKLESNSQTIEVPITERFLPNAFVSVVVVKGNAYDAGLGVPASGGIDERQVASFKVGYATLQVNTENKRLNVAISSDKPSYAPGENVTLHLKSTDFGGKGLPAELSVAVVDESVLSLTASVTADLLNVFYRQRMLGVGFAETLTKALSRINVQVEAGMKGGGGGAMAVRGDFKDTAYFKADIKTDFDGNGTLQFKLPDNLTSWQVMAIGISDDRKNEQALVGSGKYSFVVNKDLLVRPVVPRFMTSGDAMQVSAIVHNYTPDSLNVKVSLVAEGLQVLDAVDQNITLASKTEQKVNWKVKIGGAGMAKMTFTAVANGGQRGDSVEQILPVQGSSFPETVAAGKVIDGSDKDIQKVWLPKGLDLSKGHLDISVAATFAGVLNDGLKYLVGYPYGCSEQLASSILPNLALKELISTGKFKTADLQVDQIDKNVKAGLQELYKNQQPDGGFGLWQDSKTNAYITAYVAETLSEAKTAGYAVDQGVLDRAVKFLKNYVSGKTAAGVDPKFEANNRAYVLFVMSEIGQGDLALNNNLYGQKDKLRLVSKAYLAMSLQKSAGVEKGVADKINVLKGEMENAALQTPRGVTFAEVDLDYSLFDSNTRTTAVVLKALNRIEPTNPLIPKIISELLGERKGGHYATTQETAATMLALIEYLKSSGELSPAFEALVAINGQQVMDENFTSANLFDVKTKQIALKDLLPNNLDNEIGFQKTGKGKMYTDMNLTYYLPLDQQKAENEGIDVDQAYYTTEDVKMEHPLSSAVVGQNLHGHLTVMVPEDRHYVMVEDFFPAGLEGIDFNLNTSEQALQDGGGDCGGDCGGNWYFNHSEVKDDRMMYFADFLPKGVYEIDYYVRATSVGKFADLPVSAQETYYPEVFGRTEGKSFEVSE